MEIRISTNDCPLIDEETGEIGNFFVNVSLNEQNFFCGLAETIPLAMSKINEFFKVVQLTSGCSLDELMEM